MSTRNAFFKSPARFVTRLLVGLIVLSVAYSTLAAPVTRHGETASSRGSSRSSSSGVRSGSAPSRHVPHRNSVSAGTSHAPAKHGKGAHCRVRSRLHARMPAADLCGETIIFENDHKRSAVLGNHIGGGNAGEVFELTSHWPSKPNVVAVAKQYKKDQTRIKEISNLRHGGILIDEGTFKGSHWGIVPRVDGVLLLKFPFLTKTWGPASEARMRECEAAMDAIFAAVMTATQKAARQLYLVNEDIDPGNYVFTEAHGMPLAHLFDWGRARQLTKTGEIDWKEIDDEIAHAVEFFFTAKWFCHEAKGKIGFNEEAQGLF